MNNKSRVILFVSLMGLPVLLSFQNCARNGAQMTDAATPNQGLSSSIDTNDLPSDVTQSFDESGNPVGDPGKEDGGSSPEEQEQVGIQIEDPDKEFDEDIDSAFELCEEHRRESVQPDKPKEKNGQLSNDGRCMSHIRGKKVLAPEDFDGKTEIDSITDAFGKIILCNLRVKNMEKTGGRLILVDSEVYSVKRHYGDVGINGDGRANISDSNVNVRKRCRHGRCH